MQRLLSILFILATFIFSACEGSRPAISGCDGNCGGLDQGTDIFSNYFDSYLPKDQAIEADVTTCPPQTTTCGTECCTSSQICQNNSCVNLGYECNELWPCPEGQTCDDLLGRCIPYASKCEYRPPVGVFTPTIAWEWTQSTVESAHNQVMMAPMVANLTDDNGDGKIDRNDIPDIVFNTYAGSAYTKNGILRVISGDGKGEHFSIADPLYRTHPGTQIALGDIDNDGKVEIIACADGGGTIAFENDGTFKWKNEAAGCYAPSIADMDGDGQAEVLVRQFVLEGETGILRWSGTKNCSSFSIAVDLNDDGKPEVVCGRVTYNNDGTVLWEDTSHNHCHPAVADLDGDQKAEVLCLASGDHELYAYHADGTLYWGPVDVNQGHADLNDKCQGCGGGPPTIADFDGDGMPEIATAGGYGYVIFEHDGTPKWFQPTRDLSSRSTGSSVFDFEGDGKAEAVYGDELLLRIYDGNNGDVLFSYCNTSGTLQEYPLIVDVDNDDHAEIVVANNNYAFKTCADGSASSTGIRVLKDTKNNWVRTRRIWNQHTYHVTNVDEDGRIPKVEQQHWKNSRLNSFRQNVQPGGLFDAPDMQADSSNTPSCGGQGLTVDVKVLNEGAARVVAGLNVTLYADLNGTITSLQTLQTTKTLYPQQNEILHFDVALPTALKAQTIKLHVIVDDDGSGQGSVNECLEDNNRIDLGEIKCDVIR